MATLVCIFVALHHSPPSSQRLPIPRFHTWRHCTTASRNDACNTMSLARRSATRDMRYTTDLSVNLAFQISSSVKFRIQLRDGGGRACSRHSLDELTHGFHLTDAFSTHYGLHKEPPYPRIFGKANSYLFLHILFLQISSDNGALPHRKRLSTSLVYTCCSGGNSNI